MTRVDTETLITAISKVDAWLQSMRQPGGYGGPVAHWWHHCLLYTGPGIDWRYEGILAGYHLLFQKTRQSVWKDRLATAVKDVVDAQRPDGSYNASQFELNPGTLGTPHEAAATLGLLTAYETLGDDLIVSVAEANLNDLIHELWDVKAPGFNDRPGIRGRVPNKLATLAECLMVFYSITGETLYSDRARSALDSVLSYQVASGAIHQYGHNAGAGDNKFFPFYNARCVPPLVRGSQLLEDERYFIAAQKIVAFLDSIMTADGSWDQIVYPNKRRAYSPRWIAGAADILRAYQQIGVKPPANALIRILGTQLASGGFPTAEGFSRRFRPFVPDQLPTFHDVLPVVGWNDKIFRYLVEQLPIAVDVPTTPFENAHRQLANGRYHETVASIRMTPVSGTMSFEWNKQEPWSRLTLEAFA